MIYNEQMQYRPGAGGDRIGKKSILKGARYGNENNTNEA